MNRSKWFWRAVAFAALADVVRQIGDLGSEGLHALVDVPIICALFYGVFSYAFGRRVRLLTFWKVFALFFSLRMMTGFGGSVGEWILFARRTQQSLIRPDVGLGLADLVLPVLLAVALLRYAELLGRYPSEQETYEQTFA